MNDLEKNLEQLQNLSRDKKIKIMWIGVPIVMIAVVFIWLSYTDFSFKKDDDIDTKNDVSKLEILKNGFKATLKDAGNLLKDFKEKINQTNTFEITAPASSTQASATTTTTN
ncbi:MAG: hypothetical protein AAB621_00700 [Patescibacteria group bacterium]